MKVISIGTDESLLTPTSRSFNRVKDYAQLVNEFYFFVFTKNQNAQTIQEGNFKVIPIKGKNKFQQVRLLFRFFTNSFHLTSKEWKSFIIMPQDAFEIGFLSWVLAKQYGCKLLVQMHTDISTPYFRNESWRNFSQYFLAKFVLRQADAVRVVSQKMQKYVNKLLTHNKSVPGKVFLLPIYTDISKFKFNLKRRTNSMGIIPLLSKKRLPQVGGDFGQEKKIRILMISRIEEVKNIPLGIRAVQAFRKISRASVKLRIVGKGNLKQKYLNTYKNKDWVDWADWTDNVEKEYHQADLLLITSNYEGWGLTAVESVACGTPVAISPVGVANEFIVDGVNGYVARGHDILNITEAIYKTLTHKFDSNKMKDSLLQLETNASYLDKFKNILNSLK